MAEEPSAEPGAQPVAKTLWLPVKRAARVLGVSEQAVRRRIKRGTIETRREVAGNQARLLVLVEHPIEYPVERQNEHLGAELGTERGIHPDSMVALLKATVERLERDNADLRAERDRILAIIERLTAERIPLPRRRPWPGLIVWARRIVYGNDRGTGGAA